MSDESWILFLDDQRRPNSRSTMADVPDMENASILKQVRWARTFDEATTLIEFCGMPTAMYLDGHLGPGKSGMDFLKWLAENHRDAMRNVTVHCHSGCWETQHAMRTFVTTTWP